MPYRFPIKVKNPPGFINARILKDNFKRQQFRDAEIQWLALKYISRNQKLPARVRLEAQMQMTAGMPHYTRLTEIKDRCVESGHARGIINDFRLCRYQFREKALRGDLPGVKKGVW